MRLASTWKRAWRKNTRSSKPTKFNTQGKHVIIVRTRQVQRSTNHFRQHCTNINPLSRTLKHTRSPDTDSHAKTTRNLLYHRSTQATSNGWQAIVGVAWPWPKKTAALNINRRVPSTTARFNKKKKRQTSATSLWEAQPGALITSSTLAHAPTWSADKVKHDILAVQVSNLLADTKIVSRD